MRQAEPGDDGRPATSYSVRQNVGETGKSVSTENRRAVKHHTTGIWPSIAYGVEQYGMSPTDLKQFRSTAAACSGVGGHQSCLVTTIEAGMGQQYNPAIQPRLCIFSWWLRFWDESRQLHQPVRKAWKHVHSTLRFTTCRWRLVRGPMSSVVATLMDLGWIPLEPDKWESLAGDWWEFSGGTFANILDEIYTCTVNMEWTKSQHALGRQRCGARRRHVWFSQTARLACQERFAW